MKTAAKGLFCTLAAACSLLNSVAAEDILIADFEGTDYGNWRVTGEAFGSGPPRGALPGQMHVLGFKGSGLVNSFYKGDSTTGTLTSPAIRIERRYITFLIGGGKNAKTTCMNLIVDGRVVRTATGPNDQPGGSEELEFEFWDVAEFNGKSAVIEIVDQATGGWGHINVDHIVQANRLPALPSPVRQEFKIERQYLNLPIKNGGPKRKVKLRVDGAVVVVNDIELADAAPDWWAFLDVGAWKGKTVVLEVDRLAPDSTALSSIEQSDTFPGEDRLYSEQKRGQFHFSPRRGWNNDPNGMVYFNGEYHLFFQHNPYGWGWGNMHWGHAVSTDMIHWRELGDKLAPDPFGPMFSGSAVVDWKNTSGFGRNGKPPLVLIYTAAGKPTVQCIAYSTDGRNFTKYSGNPVLGQITDGNRDPKVMWHEPTGRWVMVLYVGKPGNKHTVYFFTSPNLREWELASVTEGVAGSNYLYECPDFFELAVDGDAARKKWVLLGANGEYGVGTFDGKTFTPEFSKIPGHRGRGFYAPQTFSDIPAKDGRRIMIGWFQTETRGMPFNQSMTIPLELGLMSTADGPRMTFNPAKETDSLRTRTQTIESMTLRPDSANPLAKVETELLELRTEIEPVSAGSGVVSLDVRGIDLSFDFKKQELAVNGHKAPAPLRNGRLRLTVYCDRTGLEIFAADGLTYVPFPVQPAENNRSLAIKSREGEMRVVALQVHKLRSAWPSR